jgi:ribosomal small subunit protein bTHX
MGKGDRKTAKGKRFSKSFGKTRRRASDKKKKSQGPASDKKKPATKGES